MCTKVYKFLHFFSFCLFIPFEYISSHNEEMSSRWEVTNTEIPFGRPRFPCEVQCRISVDNKLGCRVNNYLLLKVCFAQFSYPSISMSTLQFFLLQPQGKFPPTWATNVYKYVLSNSFDLYFMHIKYKWTKETYPQLIINLHLNYIQYYTYTFHLCATEQ